MTREELKRFAQVSVAAVVVLWIAWLLASPVEVPSTAAFKRFSTLLGVLVLFWTFYVRLGWRLPLLRLLFDRPDLTGTWLGQLRSDWVDERGSTVAPLDIVLVVHQTFLRIVCMGLTVRRESVSYTSSLMRDSETKSTRLVFVYSEKRTYKAGLGNHAGVADLKATGKPPIELRGEYWTNEKTQGFMHLRRAHKRPVQSYEEAKRTWPSPDDWARVNPD